MVTEAEIDAAIAKREKEAAIDAAIQKRQKAPARPLYDEFKRQLGLTTRHGLEGLAQTADIFTQPIRQGLNLIPGVDIQGSTTDAVSGMLDQYGAPMPENDMENIVGAGSRFLAGGAPFIGAGNVAAKGVNEVVKGVGRNIAAEPGLQAASAITGGAAGEATKQQGYGEGTQLAATLAAGFTPMGIKALYKNYATKPVQTVHQTIETLGIDLNGLQPSIRNELTKMIDDALDAGMLDEDALMRLMDYRKLGAQPTKATVTQNPIHITQQKNLAATGANTSSEHLQKLAMVENDNAKVLIDQLKTLTGGEEFDLYRAGAATIKNIKNQSGTLKAWTKSLYDRAKASAGRDIELDRETMLKTATNLLKQENKTKFLPAKVWAQISEDVPMTVDALDNYQTIVSNAIHKASRAGDGNTVQALKQVQKALIDTPIHGNVPKEAINAYRQARDFNRKMKLWEESIPAFDDVLNKGATPDKFVQNYIIGNTDKASTANVNKLALQIKGDKDAQGIVKGQIAAWLLEKAQPNQTNVSVSANGLRNALKSIGDRKLSMFFSDSEIEKLKTIMRVASYEANRPSGSKVNESKSATTWLGAMYEFIAKLPGVGFPVRMAKETIGPPFQTASGSLKARDLLNPDVSLPGVSSGKNKILPALPITYGELGEQQNKN